MLSTEPASPTTVRRPLSNLQRLADVHAAASLSLLPLRPGRANDPWTRHWQTYLHRRPSSGEVAGWFAEGVDAIALVAGVVRGGLAWLDFDDESWFVTWLWALPSEAAELSTGLPLAFRTGVPEEFAKDSTLMALFALFAQGSLAPVPQRGRSDPAAAEARPTLFLLFLQRAWLRKP
jgi:hypothetical protein